MARLGHFRAHTSAVPNFRLGRKATKHVRTLFDRFWLQAEIRMAAFYVGLTSSSGHSAAEFPLLIAQRTSRVRLAPSRRLPRIEFPPSDVQRLPDGVIFSVARPPWAANPAWAMNDCNTGRPTD